MRPTNRSTLLPAPVAAPASPGSPCFETQAALISVPLRWSIALEALLLAAGLQQAATDRLAQPTICLTMLVILVSIGCERAFSRGARHASALFTVTQLAYLSWLAAVVPIELVALPPLLMGSCILAAAALQDARGAVWVVVAGAGIAGGTLGRATVPQLELLAAPALALGLPGLALLGFAHIGYATAAGLKQIGARHSAELTTLSAAHGAVERQLVEQTAALADAEAAVAAARLRHEFLALVSHELRTPLNAVINFSRLIGKPRYGTLNDQQRQFQEWTLLNARHLTQIINDILDFARIENGQVELMVEPVDLPHLLRSCVETASGLLDGKPIRLQLQLPAESVPLVSADPTRLRQIVLNLLANALKFTAAGAITVTLTREAESITIAVADTGIGIAPDDYQRIFEPFRQAQSELTRQYEGAGLGLTISRRLVELHGGRMWVESTLGAGATFSFSLRAVGPAAPLAEPELPQDAPCIVVVDDNAQSQAIFEAYLTHAGYRCCAVRDSHAAVAAVRAARPIGVFLDVNMPGLDGWDVLSTLRADPATMRVPVAMCSIADPHPPLGNQHRPDVYFVKPIEERQLLSQVAHWAARCARTNGPTSYI